MYKYNLETNYKFNINSPLSEYPRKQFERDSYFNLNGLWKYKVFSDNNLFTNYNKDIVVPYCIESPLSDVSIDLKDNEKIGYLKVFSFPKDFIKDIIYLHFGAISGSCDIYLNRNFIYHNEDSFTPISVDISKYIKDDKNEIVIIVHNNRLPLGRQNHEGNKKWHSIVSGIWQTVWCESVGCNHIKNIKYITDLDNKTIEIKIDCEKVIEDIPVYCEVFFGGKPVKKCKMNNNACMIKLDDVYYWSPEEANLYDVRIKLDDDEVYSYFGMRKFSIEDITGKKMICLNNEAFYLNGVATLGYYPDGLYTPKNYDIMKYELKTLKDHGFNTIRVLDKIECDLFYYYCDKLGIIVWQDFVSNCSYNRFFDSFVPRHLNSNVRLVKNKISKSIKDEFIDHINEVYNYLKNHTSIGLWTVFNEGRGQFNLVDVTNILRTLDNSRIIDSASGWFYRDNENSINSVHQYGRNLNFNKGKLGKAKGAYIKPLVISSFSGVDFAINDDNKEEVLANFNKNFKNLYENCIINNLANGISGSIYYMLTDVENEYSGIFTYDRKICKLDRELALNLNKRIKCGSYGK